MTAPNIQTAAIFIPLAHIRMPVRLRDVDQPTVEMLAASIEEHGLEQAIVVRPTNAPDDPQPYLLVAGAHRYTAVELLGWAEIQAVVRDLNGEQARLVEIDENLMRRELHALDRAVFLSERKRLYEAMNPETRNGGDRKSKRDQIRSQTLRSDFQILPPRFTTDAAAKTGMSERAIQLAIQIASIDPEALRVLRRTPLASNQSALLALSKEPPARQRALAFAMQDGGPKTIAAAKVAAGFEPAPEPDDPHLRQVAQIHAAWAKASDDARAEFLRDIDAAYTEAKPAAKPARASRR